MVTLPTMSSFLSTCGCFLRGGRTPSGDLPPPVAASWCKWLSPCEWRRLQGFRVEDPSGARKGGLNRHRKWAGPTGTVPFRPGSVAPSLPWVLRWLCTLPLPLAWFWRCHPRVQDGGSPWMKFGLLRFKARGCSYVALRLFPPLEVNSLSSWTRTRLRKCSFELVANPFFMFMQHKHNTSKCMHIDERVIWLVGLMVG
jgi:hypothetical protein